VQNYAKRVASALSRLLELYAVGHWCEL